MSFVSKLFGGKDAPKVPDYQASPITTPYGTVTPSGAGGVSVSLSPELQKFFNLYIHFVLHLYRMYKCYID